jgi:hypothetical protein
MSTVLERMIQRTRSPLSSLEPVIRPHFTPRTSAGLGTGIADPAAQADAEGALGQAVAAQLPHSSPSARPGAGSATTEAAPWLGEAEPPTVPSSRPQPADVRRPGQAVRTTPHEPVVWPGSRTAGSRAADVMRELQDPGPPQAPPPTAEPPVKPDVTGPAAAGRQTQPAAAIAAEGVGTAMTPEAASAIARPSPFAPSVETTGEVPPAPTMTAAGAAMRPEATAVQVPATLLHSAPPDAVPAGPRKRQEAPPGGSRAGPDISISIGHIEVRAAPAIDRPQRTQAPFRPNVSLADFLHQPRERRL